MKYYAYKGQHTLGREPLGSDGKILVEFKSDRYAIRHAIRYLGADCSVFRYSNFYDNKTFNRIK